MNNMKAIIEIQTKANESLLAYTSEMNEVDKAHHFGRATGLIASIKYLTDNDTYQSIAKAFAAMAIEHANNEGTILIKEGK